MNGPPNPRRLILIAFLFAMLGASAPASAQDSHYWSDQWGTRANLLGGVVIGSEGDLSSTYYNPGFLGMGAETAFLATKVYSISSFRMPGTTEQQLDLSSTRLSAAPDFIAGEFTFDWLGRARLAYSLLSRYSTSFEIKGRVVQPAFDSLGPASKLSSGEIFTRQTLTEVWGGITYAHPIGETIGLGATLYGAYRSQRDRALFSAASTDSLLQTETISGISDGNYWNGRFLMKLGLAWRGENLTLGMNCTTPSLSVLGQGTYFEQVATGGVTGFDPPLDDSFHSSVYEDDLSASYHTSWAIGFGGSYRFGQVRIHGAAEYFAEVDPYLVMETSPWYPQSGGELTQRRVFQNMASVFNFGLGVEVPLSESWLGYGSIISDHSGAVSPSVGRDTVGIAIWDVYQFSAGAEIKFSKGEANLGLSYAFANDTVRLDNPVTEDGNPILGEDVQVRYRRVKVLLGFTLSF